MSIDKLSKDKKTGLEADSLSKETVSEETVGTDKETPAAEAGMVLFNMPDIDLENVEEVRQRLNDYFELYTQNDMKPTVAGMALALNGMSRRTLWAIVNDAPTGGAGYRTALPSEVASSIKKAYKMMENLWETYMNSGKVNPVAGIFLYIEKSLL